MAGSSLRDREEKRAFYQSVLDAGKGLDAEAAAALAEDLAAATCQIWLWDGSVVDSLAARVTSPPSAEDTAAGPTGKPVVAPSTAAAPTGGDAGRDAFDPFAFSAVVVLKRQGPDALLARLEAIQSAADLLRLADAQHIGIDRSITDPHKLRLAILSGAEQRLADRRAAAS